MKQFNFDKINSYLKSFDNSNEDLYNKFQSFEIEYDLNIPSDPFSEEYKKHQFDLYQKITDRIYSNANEKTIFDVDAAAIKPFPYYHGDPSLVGDQLMAIGYIIKKMNLPKGSRILEFGPGWGNTTIALAKMGYKVSCIDIEERYVSLIQKRAAMEGLEIEAVCGDFSLINNIEEPYDAILFFECFHHASDHISLIAAFEKAVKPGGIVCFAAEPILSDFPIPWGLRMDGQSIWAIGRNGWLELGFNEKYFSSALSKFGWCAFPFSGHDSPISKVIIAKRSIEVGGIYNFEKNVLKHQVGILQDNSVKTDGRAGYLMYGPYVSLPSGSYTAEISLNSNYFYFGEIVLDVVADGGSLVITQKTINLNTIKDGCIKIIFNSEIFMQNVEVRIMCLENTKIEIINLKIIKI